MNKEVFLHQLRIRLTQLPEGEIQKNLEYFSELIEDKIEDGMSEEAAVASLGDINEIAQKIMEATPLSTLVKTSVKPKNGWTTAAIVMAIIGSPIWVPLALAFVLIVLSVFVCIIAIIVALFAVVISLGVAGIYLMIKSFMLIGTGIAYTLFSIGSGFALVGLCLLAFLGARIAVIGLIDLTKWVYTQVKSLFIKKEVA